MSNLPPAEVLAKRLEHELHTAHIYAQREFSDAQSHIERAQKILAQLQEAMK